jgi:hypothetical protein
MEGPDKGDARASGTPIAAVAERHDPLDSDPLDSSQADGDSGAPVNQMQLEIVRSARPHDEPATVPVYDDDPQTVWTPQADAGEAWLWLDLGLERRLREVRWLAKGNGTVEIAVSNDRQRWRAVDQVQISRGWQGVELRDDARYVRLTLRPVDEGGELPAIAETAVYGADRRPSASLDQEAADGRGRDPARPSRGDKKPASEQKTAGNASSSGDKGQKEPRSGGRLRTSATTGETRCQGVRGRCEERQGDVSVEDDCERDGTCTIDARVDGGTAVCEAVGGDATEAGHGKGRRGGRAGRCEAVANGGAVAIGDVNP